MDSFFQTALRCLQNFLLQAMDTNSTRPEAAALFILLECVSWPSKKGFQNTNGTHIPSPDGS